VTGHGSSTVQRPLGWREGIKKRADQLGRNIEGRFLVDSDPDIEAVPAELFLDDKYLEDALARASGAAAGRTGPGVLQFHAGVSRFVRHYTGSLSIAALIGLAEGVGLDVTPRHCTLFMYNDVPFRIVVNLSDDEVVRCEERPTVLRADGPVLETLAQLRAEVLQKLYGQQVAPLIDRIAIITGISTGLLWTNVAEWAGVISRASKEKLGEDAAAPYLADEQAILTADRLPGLDEHANPLRDKFEWTQLERDSYPYEVASRKLCCLTYMLDDRFGRLCGSCPHLPLEDKIALWQERHHASASASGGAAERQAIERGLQRPSMQRLIQAKRQRTDQQG
jgi:ferric iron reductase FhuF-like transporter